MLHLRPYQIEDIQFLSQLPCAGIFNEQRTGKTPTILKVMYLRRLRKVLVICPASALYQWQAEYDKWLQRPCIVLEGTAKKREKLLTQWTYGAVVSYETFKQINKQGKTYGMLQVILKEKPEAIILDEAHRIKNPKSAIAQALFQTIPHVSNRYALTGTLSSNKPYEAYSILHWLYPQKFKTYWTFINEYFETERMHNYTSGRAYIEIGHFKSGKERELQEYLTTISVQRKRKDVMPWLPKKDYLRVRLPVTQEQKKYLYELEEYFETGGIVTQGILDRLVRYRQICLHPGLLQLAGGSPKLEWIQAYLKDYPEQFIIIFSKFTSFIRLMDQAIEKKKGVIVGDTPVKERQLLKTEFQSGNINLLLINTDAGKESLTLDKAETAIFTDKYPPASDILQAEDRFVATTEEKASKSHLIIELMMAGTYDERLYDLVQQNIRETDILNDYNKYLRKENTHG